MKRYIILMILFLIGFEQLISQSYVDIRVSIKVILDSNGNRPTQATTQNIDLAFEWMNERMGEYNRGYRFVKTEEVIIGGVGSPISTQYSTTGDTIDGDFITQLETDAQNDPAAFAWRSSSINFYITLSALSNGICSFPGTASHDEGIVIDHRRADEPEVYLDEIGHFFNLSHTAVGPPNAVGTLPNDDNSWGQDSIALMNFGVVYANLTANQQLQVDETFNNIMSQVRGQGENRTILVEEQMDRWTQALHENANRQDVTSGLPYHVDKDNRPFCNTLVDPCICFGTPEIPLPTIVCALDKVNASGNDVITILPETYNFPNTVISQPVLLIATRQGDVILK